MATFFERFNSLVIAIEDQRFPQSPPAAVVWAKR